MEWRRERVLNVSFHFIDLSQIHIPRYFRAAELTRGPSRYPSLYRRHLLDCIAPPAAIQNLAQQVYYQTALILARESRPSASGPIPLRTVTCVFPSNHIPSLIR